MRQHNNKKTADGYSLTR